MNKELESAIEEEVRLRTELAQLRGKLNALARIAKDPDVIKHEFMQSNLFESLIQLAEEEDKK